MKKFANGVYRVKITEITKGESEKKKTPYFQCRFMQGERFIDERFYMGKNSLPYIKMIYSKVGVYSDNYNGDELLNKELFIKIGSGSKIVNDNLITYPEIVEFFSIKEFQNEKESYEYDDDENVYDAAMAAYIFCVEIEDVARGRGIDPSDVTPNMIHEYCGY